MGEERADGRTTENEETEQPHYPSWTLKSGNPNEEINRSRDFLSLFIAVGVVVSARNCLYLSTLQRRTSIDLFCPFAAVIGATMAARPTCSSLVLFSASGELSDYHSTLIDRQHRLVRACECVCWCYCNWSLGENAYDDCLSFVHT